MIGLFALASLAVQLIVLRHRYLTGISEYDDAVYIETALRIVHGVLPYRDFASVSQPGLALLMIPLVAVLRARSALVAARVLTAMVTAGNVALAGVLARRGGAVAVAVTCTVLAFSPAAVLSGRTLLEEPYLTLFCLIGAIAVCEGRVVSGGLAFGFAVAIKALAVAALVPALVVLVILGPEQLVARWRGPAREGRRGPARDRWRGAARLASGSVVGFVVPCLPFLLASPGRFVHDVVVVQASTVEPGRLGVGARLAYLTGAFGVPWQLPLVAVVAVTAVVVLLLSAGAWRSQIGRFSAATVMLASAVLMWRAAFYYHYAGFVAPFIALGVGAAVARVRWAPVVAVGAAVVGVTFAVRVSSVPAGDPSALLDRVIPRSACVVSDDPAYMVVADRVPPAPGACPDLVDPLAATWVIDGGRRPAASDPVLVAAWLGWIARADVVILSDSAGRRLPRAPVTAYVHANFREVSRSPAVWVRNR